LLDALVQATRAKAQAKGLALELDITPDLPRALVGDPQRLGQVLGNFAGNAVKFTDTGRVTIGVGVAGSGGGRVELLFTISDTGPGIPPEQMATLFRGFTQGDGSATRRHGGTGLGLVIAKQLAELMGGSVGVDSRPGEGSSFWLRLGFGRAQNLVARKPDATAELPAPDATAMPVAAAAEEQRPLDPALLKTLAAQIESWDTGSADTALLLRGMRGVDARVLTALDERLANFDFDGARTALATLCEIPQRPGE
jgi:two-component system sensor histidine kinase/response regulator